MANQLKRELLKSNEKKYESKCSRKSISKEPYKCNA